MRFTLQVSDLLAALDVVGIVPPEPTTPKGGAGYLFTVVGNLCHIHSRNSQSVAKASFPVTEAEDGSFAYPAEYIAALRFLDGQDMSIETEESVEDDRFLVRYVTSKGSKSERMSFNPKYLQNCDTDLAAAEESFDLPSTILKDAITLARPFCADANDAQAQEFLKTVQVFGSGDGDGYLYSSDGKRHFYFWCAAFKGKAFEIHGQYIGPFLKFLARGNRVKIKRGERFTFAENNHGHVLGWPKQVKTHTTFKYMGVSQDTFVFGVDRVPLLNILKYVRSELDSTRDRIRIKYLHEDKTLQFLVAEGTTKAESQPLPVRVKEREVPDPSVQVEDGAPPATKKIPWESARDWTFDININAFTDLVRDVKSPQVELRVTPYLPKIEGSVKVREASVFRTIDNFLLDEMGKVVIEEEKGALKCRVTRFTSSKN